jgi:WD40 repeat protein
VTGEIELVKEISAHDNEVICLAYSPAIPPTVDRSLGSSLPMTKERYWLASGSRDKLIHIFDSENKYEAVAVLEQHQSTITGLRFNQVHKLIKNELHQELSLISASADKLLSQQQLDLDLVQKAKTFQQLQQTENLFQPNKNEIFKSKIFSMDVAEQA